MHTFRVWAPGADTVDVVLGDDRHPMARLDGGWWQADVQGAGPGTDYLFSVDGGEPRPDPRSMWQPSGVDGPSRVVDHTAFEWTDQQWFGRPLAGLTIYELHVGTFTDEGTFDAAIAKLDHLVDLGVGAAELLPVAEFPGRRGWGYDGVDLFAPHSAYGGPDGLKRLVDACHAKGLAVVMDVVYNHLGPAGNYLPGYGPYFTDRYNTPWGQAVNYDDAGSDEVRAFVLDNAELWLRDYHCDGLRLDAVHAIFDLSARHLLAELSERVEALEAEVGRDLFLIAESDLNDPRVIEPRAIGGHGMDAQWSDDFHHALHTVLTGERSGYYADFGSWDQLAKAFRQAFVYDGTYAPERGRRHGRPPLPGTKATRFLGYLQDHDQIGNRATGERSSHLMSPGRLRIGAALVLCSPFVPMLFQGEEWGASTPFQYFTDHPDPELGRAVSEGRRREFASFGWKPEDVPDPQDPATFERSKLRWEEAGQGDHAQLLAWHRDLLRLRRTIPDLADGSFERVECRWDEQAGWFVLQRGSVVVACNLAGGEQEVPLGLAADEVLLASPGAELQGAVARLPADAVLLAR